MAKFNQPPTEFIQKPTTIPLANYPFGKELYFWSDIGLFSQPRKYLYNWPGTWDPGRGYLYLKDKYTEATKQYILIDYDTGITPIYCYIENGEQLSCVNGRGRYDWNYTNYRAPMTSGYTDQKGTARQRYLNNDLTSLDSEFLKKKSTNFLYYQFGDDSIWFYNEINDSGNFTGKILPACYVNIDPSQYTWQRIRSPFTSLDIYRSYIKDIGKQDTTPGKKQSRDIIKNLNAFWSAFSFIRRYVSWAYWVIQYVEDVNKGGKSIGDTVYISNDVESIYNGWWNGPSDVSCPYCFPPTPPLFSAQEIAQGKDQEYVQNIASVIEYMKLILTDPTSMFQLERGSVPEYILRFWTDIPAAGKIWDWVVPQGPPPDFIYARDLPPAATETDFINLWTELITNLPTKYRHPKIGIYAIPDTYYYDIGGVPDNASGGWYGEDLFPDDPAGPKESRVWNSISERSKDAVNEAYVEKYKVLLDAVDFITPQVYVYKRKNISAGCNGDYKLEKLNKFGRNHFDDFTFHSVKRAALYNKKYGKNKPILPMISTGFPGQEEFKSLFEVYCNDGVGERAWYEPDIHNTVGNDGFILDRFLDTDTLKHQLKLCFDAVESPNEIAGFLFWNGQVPRLIAAGDNSNRYDPNYAESVYWSKCYASDGSRISCYKYLQLRRIYALDVDRTVNPFDETKWTNELYITHKTKVARKEMYLMDTVNRSVLYSETVGGITPEIQIEQDRGAVQELTGSTQIPVPVNTGIELTIKVLSFNKIPVSYDTL